MLFILKGLILYNAQLHLQDRKTRGGHHKVCNHESFKQLSRFTSYPHQQRSIFLVLFWVDDRCGNSVKLKNCRTISKILEGELDSGAAFIRSLQRVMNTSLLKRCLFDFRLQVDFFVHLMQFIETPIPKTHRLCILLLHHIPLISSTIRPSGTDYY